MTDTLVSVLCPTRGRRDLLRQSIESLRDTASDPSRIEVCCAADPDDIPRDVLGIDLLHVTPHRYGYTRLHEYYNDLARLASGKWHMLWNDDAVMRTPGWDAVLAARCEDGVLLWPYVPEEKGMNCCPIWPASWPALLGHVSLNSFNDRWLIEIAETTRRHRHVPIVVSHRRVGDQTAEEAHKVSLSSFYEESLVAQRSEDIRKITEAFPGSWNGNLVSVLLSGEGMPHALQHLWNDAEHPSDTEFLIAAGSQHESVRRALEDCGLMGQTEVHVTNEVPGLRAHAHGGHVVESRSFMVEPGWDEKARTAA